MATSSQFIPVTKSELAIFNKKFVGVEQTGRERIKCNPYNAVSPTTKYIKFFHPGKGADWYRNLYSTYLYFSFNVTNKKGEDITDDKYALINYIAATLISSIEVALNGVVVTRNADNYAYRAFLECVLTNDKLDAECHMRSSGFIIDEGEKVDSFDPTTNPAHKKRAAEINKSKKVEVIARLHADVFNSHLFYPNGLDLEVNVTLNTDQFVLLTNDTTPDAVLKLSECSLFTEICHINPAVLTAHARAFQNDNATYPLQHVEVQTLTVPKGQRYLMLDNVFSGKLPNLIIVGMVDNNAYAGDMTSNPLCFKHYSLKDITFSLNGIPYKTGPLDFESNAHVMGYHQLLEATGLLHNTQPSVLTLDRYKHGLCLFAADLSAEGQGFSNGTHSSVQPVGNVRIEANFEKAPTEAITFVIYSIRDGGAIEIDKNRNVFVGL